MSNLKPVIILLILTLMPPLVSEINLESINDINNTINSKWGETGEQRHIDKYFLELFSLIKKIENKDEMEKVFNKYAQLEAEWKLLKNERFIIKNRKNPYPELIETSSYIFAYAGNYIHPEILKRKAMGNARLLCDILADAGSRDFRKSNWNRLKEHFEAIKKVSFLINSRNYYGYIDKYNYVTKIHREYKNIRKRKNSRFTSIMTIFTGIALDGLGAAIFISDLPGKCKRDRDDYYQQYLQTSDPGKMEELHRMVVRKNRQAGFLNSLKWCAVFAGSGISIYGVVSLAHEKAERDRHIKERLSMIFPETE